MYAYIRKLSDTYSIFIQTPQGRYVELRDASASKIDAEKRIFELGYTLSERPVFAM